MTDTDPYLVSVVTHRPAYGRYGYADRATHEPSRALRGVSALRVGIAIAITYALIIGAMLVTPS